MEIASGSNRSIVAKALRGFACLVMLSGPLLRVGASGFPWFNKNVLKAIQITGRRTIGYHRESVSGSGDSFNSLNYFGQGAKPIIDTGQVSIVGRKVLGVLNFSMLLQDNRFGDPQGQTVSLNYDKKPFSMDLGDIRGSLLNTNQFVSFSKSLDGAVMGYSGKRLKLRALRSDVKGSVRTVSLSGNGGLGPYYLNSSQIIPDTEKIMVDGVLMRPGTDYTINYDAGSITFINRPIAQTSTLVASYEARSYNTGRGTIQGVGASYDLGRFGSIGLTAVEQLTGDNRTLSSRADFFQGFGSPASPYFLQYDPMPGTPIFIKLDGVLQTQGVDYVFDTGNPGIFYFTRFVASSSTIEADYTPRPTQAVDGTRKVQGFDFTIPLGKGSKIAYSQATGRLLDNLTPLSGTARGLRSTLVFKGLTFKANFRDVPQGFVGIETGGFNRNEKSTDLSLEGHRKALDWGISTDNSLISSMAQDALGNLTFASGRVTQSRAYARLAGKRGIWTLDQTRLTSSGGGGNSTLDTTTLSTQQGSGRANLNFGFDRTTGTGTVLGLAGGGLGHLTSDAVHLAASYDPGRSVTLSSKASLSANRTDVGSSRGTDLSLSAGYHPPGPLALDLSYNLSHSGELAALSQFQSGQGFGYGGSGFSAAPTGAPISNSATDVNSFQFVGSDRLNRKVSLQAHYIQNSTAGSVSSNANTATLGGAFQVDLGRANNLNLALDRTVTRYLGATSGSSATIFNAYLYGTPVKNWAYQLGLSSMLSSGGLYSQNRFAIQGSLHRRLDAIQSLSLQFQSGRTTGYLPQVDGYVTMSYAYQIYRPVALVSSFTWSRLANLNFDQTAGGYVARGFNIQLSFDFGN